MAGFVDLQINGWKGMSFLPPDVTVDTVREITREMSACGTAAYCPTVSTRPFDTYEESFTVLADAIDQPEIGPHILGIHVEGPFISPLPGAAGAHNPDLVRDPSIEEFDRFQEWARGNIKILTLAPERPGALDLIRHASERGVVVLFGHHLASDDEMIKGVEAGAVGSTHIGNAIPNEIHRHENPLWHQLACDDLWGLFITDGNHLPADLIKVALRAKGVERFIVTSDTAVLGGMPPGKYNNWGLDVEINEEGRIFSPETGMLVCSHANMIECMNYLASLDLLDEADLWKVGLSNPLALLGMDVADLKGVPERHAVFRKGRFGLEGSS